MRRSMACLAAIIMLASTFAFGVASDRDERGEIHVEPPDEGGSVSPSGGERASARMPDIAVTSLSWSSAAPVDGTSITLFAQVKNIGTSDVTSAIECAFFSDGELIAKDNLQGLDINDSAVVQATMQPKPGEHTIRFLADSSDSYGELNETNNIMVSELSVGYPNIVMKRLNCFPSTFSDGERVTFFAELENSGTETARAFAVAFYIDGEKVSTKPVQGIPGGGSAIISSAHVLSGGQHIIRAEADVDDVVIESNETDNSMFITIESEMPELSIELAGMLNGSFVDGEEVTFEAKLVNSGGATQSPFFVDMYIDGKKEGTQAVFGLGNRSVLALSYSWQARAGAHDVGFVVDPSNAVAEACEWNNYYYMNISSNLPDLEISMIQPSVPEPTDGEAVTVVASVTNIGLGRTMARFLGVLYVDGMPADYEALDGLDVMERKYMNFAWTASAGAHELVVIVNAERAVEENAYWNNRGSIEVNVPVPDFEVISASSYPGSPATGENVTISVVVRNNGPGGTLRSIPVDLYSGARKVGTVEIPGLPQGSQITVQFSWLAEGGTHAFKVIVDNLNSMRESNEANNELSFTVDCPYPDLVMQVLEWTPTQPAVGTLVQFNFTVVNLGAGVNMLTKVNLSINGLEIGEVGCPALASGMGVSLTYGWVATSPVFYAACTADSRAQVRESNEANNRLAKDALGNTLANSEIDVEITSMTVFGLGSVGAEASFVINLTSNADAIVPVALYSETESVGTVDVSLRANQEAIAILNWAVKAGMHNFVARVDPDDMIDEDEETNNVLSCIVECSAPDLAVSSISWNAEGIDYGNDVVVFASIDNLGPGNLSTPVFATLFVDGAAVSGASIASSLAGTRQTASFAWRAEPGAHSIMVAVDDDALVNEVNESNNCAFASISVESPRLVVRSISYFPEQADESSIVEVEAIILNEGLGGVAGQIDVALLVDGVKASETTIGGLDSLQDSIVAFEYDCRPGAHALTIVVDPDARLIEASRADNRMTVVTANVSAPDISITELFLTCQDARTGDSIAAFATVWNSGVGDTIGGFDVKFVVDGKKAGAVRIEGMLAGTSTTVSIVLFAQPHEGANALCAIADDKNSICESNEANNRVSSSGFTTAYPDLKVSFVKEANVSASVPCEGLSTPIYANIENTGGDIDSQFSVTFFVDGLVVESRSFSGFPSGISTEAFYYKAKPGLHYARLVIDPAREVEESNETNNDAYTVLPYVAPPELSITGLRTSRLGTSFLTSVHVENDGGDGLSQFKVSLYGDGVRLGEQTVDGLPGCETAGVHIQWTAKVMPKRLRAEVDSDREIIEVNEADNTYEADLVLLDANEIMPDYESRAIRLVPERPNEGTYARIYVAVSNVAGWYNISKGVRVELSDNNSMVRSFERRSEKSIVGVSSAVMLPGEIVLISFEWRAKSGSHEFVSRVYCDEKLENSANNVARAGANIGYTELACAQVRAGPSSACDGEKVTIFAKVINAGDTALERTISVELFIEGKLCGMKVVYGMMPNSSCEVAFDWLAVPGTSELAVYVARDEGIFELTTDDFVITSIEVAYPDIRTADIVDAYASSSAPERPSRAFVKLDTAGNSTSGGFSIRTYYVDLYSDGKLAARAYAFGAAPGHSSWVSFEHKGTHSVVKAVADSNNDIRESIETNNVASKEMPDGALNVTDRQPDISIARTSYHQYNADGAAISNRITLNITLANIGLDDARDMRLAIICDGILAGSISVQALEVGEKNCTFTFAPSTREHRLKFVADAEFVIPESTETNNFKIMTIPQNVPPYVRLTTDRIYAEVGVPVSFIADGLDNDDGVPTSFSWDFEGDGTYDWTSGAVASATHTYTKNGTYMAHLFVIDSKGASAEGIVYVFVANAKPKAPKTDDYRQYWAYLNVAALAVLTGLCYYIIKGGRTSNGASAGSKKTNANAALSTRGASRTSKNAGGASSQKAYVQSINNPNDANAQQRARQMN